MLFQNNFLIPIPNFTMSSTQLSAESFNPCCQEAGFIHNKGDDNMWYKPEQYQNRRGFLDKTKASKEAVNITSFEWEIHYSIRIKGWKDKVFKTDIMSS